MSLTNHLLALHQPLFKNATNHPFLKAAGRGTLPKHTLSAWLSQDRLYAQSYINFVGALIAKTHLPHAHYPGAAAAAAAATATAATGTGTEQSTGAQGEKTQHENENLEWRIMTVLNLSLANILAELQFFESTAAKYGLNLEQPGAIDEGADFEAVPATTAYEQLFRSFGASEQRIGPEEGSAPRSSRRGRTALLEGLVVLWATELCYYRAWSFARSHGNQGDDDDGGGGGGKSDADGGALRNEFIPNWTSPAFGHFVEQLAEIVDAVAAKEGLMRADGTRAEFGRLAGLEELWQGVLEVEAGFWPDV